MVLKCARETYCEIVLLFHPCLSVTNTNDVRAQLILIVTAASDYDRQRKSTTHWSQIERAR